MFENPEQAFGGSKPMLELIELIYAAGVDPSLWGNVMSGMGAILDGDSLGMFAFFPGSDAPEILAATDPSNDAWTQFSEYYGTINPILPACEKKLVVGETWYSERALPLEELERTEFYNDFFRPNNWLYSVGLRIPLAGLPAANISCQGSRARGPFDWRADVVCQTLKPHLTRSFQMHHQIGGLKAQIVGLEGVLSAFDHAVFGLDPQGRIAFLSQPAEALVRRGDVLRLSGGFLSAVAPEHDRQLQPLLSGAIIVGTAAGGSLRLDTGDGRPSLAVTVTPFRTLGPGRFGAMAALAIVSDPSQELLSRAALMQTLYGFTPTECRVADLLLQGKELREAAAHLKITFETIRFHTKRILSKAGVKRQIDLVRLMAALPGEPLGLD